MTVLKVMFFACVAAACLGAPVAAQEASFHYDGDLRLSPQTGSLSAHWTITAHEDDLTEVSFLLNAALGEAQIDGPDVVAVTSALTEGFNGPLRVYTVTLAPALEGADRVMLMQYAGPLFPEPPQSAINTLDPGKVEFTVDSFWMPFDQRFSSLLTADLDIWLPGEWDGVTMQTIARTAGGFHIDQDTPALDLAFTLMSDFQRVEAPGYVIYDTRNPGGGNLDALVGALEHCTGFLNDLAAGAGPLPDASIIVTSRHEGGYSRGTLIALTDIAETSEASLTQFICHELGHYWSHGNAMTVENWLNESFADYTAVIGMRAALGEAAYDERMAAYQRQIDEAPDDLPPVWTPATTERPPYLVAYRKGPLALARAEGLIGRELFARFLQAAMQARVSTTPQMLDVFQSVAGAEARTAFEVILAE
ncbi:M1 family aminopeptidase [uncultured Maricaulis sp.]|uniref:M1 family aminopeptidase n=1 Tax=uncultured Maricaulis sp. TaxID=174710 RepID=UPI0030D82097|tara:strand:- start:16157 stop:17419 length:1263 start_codon:yes stop_codon:yes gene_type:complete